MSTDPTAIDLTTDPFTQRMSGVARHGMTPFDVPFVSHIKDNLWQGGCTTGLVLPKDIQHVVSLYPWEQYRTAHEPRSMTFHWLYDADEKPPLIVHTIATYVLGCMVDGPTLIHCQAGLNRSSVVAALVLMRMGMTAADAIALLREKRSPAVLCNPSFERWLLGLEADHIGAYDLTANLDCQRCGASWNLQAMLPAREVGHPIYIACPWCGWLSEQPYQDEGTWGHATAQGIVLFDASDAAQRLAVGAPPEGSQS